MSEALNREYINRRIAIRSRFEAYDLKDRKHALKEEYSEDPIGWINDWAWLFEPRDAMEGLSLIPFQTKNDFAYQEDLIRWIDKKIFARECGMIEKSRDMGATWCFLALFTHHWLFIPYFTAGLGSRVIELVDGKSQKALFSKLRFLLKNLPTWMFPIGFRKRTNDNPCALTNPEIESSITGQGGSNIGRGDRTLTYLLDEAAHVEHPEEADSALSETTNSLFELSTPSLQGLANYFAQKRQREQIEVYTLHYTLNPSKDEKWYQNKKRTKSAHIIAVELDISYEKAGIDKVLPSEWVRAAVDFKLEPIGQLICGYDVAEFGKDENCLTPRKGPVVYKQDVWSGMDTTRSAHLVRDRMHTMNGAELNYDAIGVGAGITGALANDSEIRFKFNDVKGSRKANKNSYYHDNPTQSGYDRFKNFRAECWWNVRMMFYKTWERKEGIQFHPDEECISIPNDSVLINQLCLLSYSYNNAQQIIIQDKKKLKTSGISSPDRADSLVLAFAPLFSDFVLLMGRA